MTAVLGPRLAGIHIEPVTLTESTVTVAARFAARQGTIALLSGGDHDAAGYDILGVDPWLVLKARRGVIELTVDGEMSIHDGHPFDAVRAVLDHHRLPFDDSMRPVGAGLFGYLAYDLKDHLESLPRTCVDDLQLPTLMLSAPRVLLVHDRDTGDTRLHIPWRKGRRHDVDTIRDMFLDALSRSTPDPEPFKTHGPALPGVSRLAYEHSVQEIREFIAAGDVYQVNDTQRFRAPCSGDPFDLLHRLYDRNPAPFFAFVQGGDHQVVSTSPERFLLRCGDHVESRPIKGTRPRGDSPAVDAALRDELSASPKDDAELSMIVDLVRNDLGKVCRTGSVAVAEHKRVESYRNVHHLVSVITGRLDAGRDTVDLLRATFPGGSITGCPKIRAMEIIDELEPYRRHVYCGSIGYLGFDDTADLSIAIRTATVAGGTICWSVGGGIVHDSDPHDEYEESMHKGRTIAEACAVSPLSATSIVWHNGRLVPLHEATVPVNDLGLRRGYGLFETLRADDGRVPLLQDHVARLDSSWRKLMPSDPPDVVWMDVIAQVLTANGLDEGPALVRIVATRGTRDRAPWDHSLTVMAEPYVHRLVAWNTDGLHLATYPEPRQNPLAAHKTLSAFYYNQAAEWAREQGCHEALILNPDGTVSEGNSCGLLLIEGRQVTRPESPAALPSVMAAAVCRQLEAWGYTVSMSPVAQPRLLTADLVLATTALMGAVPVTAIDGQPRDGSDNLWRRLNDAIIPGWSDQRSI